MTEKYDYDVCIAGSGPAGAFTANLLAKHGYRVVVVEAGSDRPNPNVDDNFDLENSNLQGPINFGFSKQVGGSSNLWAGGLVEMDDIDLTSRPEYNFLSWPVDKYELRLLYRRVAEIIGVGKSDNRINKTVSCKVQDLMDSSNLEFREMILMQRPFKTRTLIENTVNITIKKNHEVCGLKLNKRKTAITTMQAFNAETAAYVDIKAKRFVLAAGAISNIRVLLHSLKVLSPSNDTLLGSIGSGFSTHPKGNVGKIKFTKNVTEDSPFLRIVQAKFGSIRYYFGLNENFLKKHNLLNHCLRVESVYALRMVRYLDVFKNLVSWLPFIKSNTTFMDLIISLGVKFFTGLEKITPSAGADGFYEVRGFFDQASKKDNKISLSSKTSVSGLPLAKIDWKYDDNDWESVDRFMLLMKEELMQRNIGHFDYSRPPDSEFTGIHSHFLGGTRAGDSPADSVVDSNLKVHGLSNLYISGPSVFPSFGYANPFFSIAALSIRLSDHLIEMFDGDIDVQGAQVD